MLCAQEIYNFEEMQKSICSHPCFCVEEGFGYTIKHEPGLPKYQAQQNPIDSELKDISKISFATVDSRVEKTFFSSSYQVFNFPISVFG